MKKTLIAGLFGLMAGVSSMAQAADYVVDTKGMHALIEFKVSHLGYSWVVGRFNKFDGNFSYDAAKPEASKISINIDTASLDTNHARRDKHLRSDDFLDVAKYPNSKFVSTSFVPTGDNTAKLTGQFTLHGVTKEVEIDVTKMGEGKDPWGGYRAGFEGTSSFELADFGMKGPGPTSGTVHLYFVVEGIRT